MNRKWKDRTVSGELGEIWSHRNWIAVGLWNIVFAMVGAVVGAMFFGDAFDGNIGRAAGVIAVALPAIADVTLAVTDFVEAWNGLDE